MTSELGTFYGNNLTWEDADYIALRSLGESCVVEAEASLFESKWFDYRFLHPLVATYLFSHHYQGIYREFVRKLVDLRLAKSIRPLRKIDIEKMGMANARGLWRARRAADRLGIPYPFFIRAAMTHADEFGWKRLPRPNHLYAEKVMSKVAEQWEARLDSFLEIPTLSRFRADPAHAHSRAVQSWLLDRIARKASPEFVLSHLLHEDPLLPLPLVEARFDARVVRRALSLAKQK